MANIIKPKRSNTAAAVPTTGQLASGELAVNMADKKVYINNGTSVVQVGAGNLSALGDANISAPSNGQSLTYDTASGKWVNTSAGTGTVTSVGMTVPTGLSVSGSPVTNSGTLAVELTAGYSIPTTASQTNWNTAYSDRLKWDGNSTGLTASTGRTSLGGSTVGQNFFTLTNPTSVTFPRINADNTVSALDAATFRTAIGAGTGSGTVTSVTGTAPIASSGGTTPAISLASAYGDTKNPYGSKTANYFLAAPNGSAGSPSFRAIVAADIPTLNQNTTGTASNVTGTVAIANGGTGSTTAAAALTALGAQAAATAINTSNIGSQSVSYATSAGNADTLDGQHGAYYQPASTAITTSNIGSQSVNYATSAGSATSATTASSCSGNAATVTGIRQFGTIAIQAVAGTNQSCTTAQFVSWYSTNYGFLSYAYTVAKCTWDYAGNNDISDTSIGSCEMAGCVIETFADGTYYTIRITRPTTGTGGSQQLVYNNQGAGYSPGWWNVLNTSNYTSYSPSLTGTGASGTWGINVTGSAGSASTATTATTANGVAAGVVSGKTIYDNFTATASQTTFTTSVAYTSGKIEVFANGVKMVNAEDVTVTSGTQVVFASGLAVNTKVTLVYPI